MRLPVMLSVPHAGLWVPPEVESMCALTPEEIADDGDGGAAEIYLPLAEHVEALVTSKIARAIVDLNRDEDDRRKDGVVKTHTCWDVPVWSTTPSEEVFRKLLLDYHRPYHEELRRPPDPVLLGVDCHTMAATAPPVAPDPGQVRPAVCLGNADGTCPNVWISTMASCFREVFDEVTINVPFRGGWIVRSHADELPWIQLELSRDPKLSFGEKRARVLQALQRWCTGVLPWLTAAGGRASAGF